MKLNVAQRMEEFQPGIFNVLDERRQQRLAQGLPVYNLSIGTPDFLPEPHVVQALAQAASQPTNYRYSLTELPELVEAVQHWYLRRYGVELEPEELMSIYGSQEGLTHIGWALCDPGDVVLVPDPGYPIFEMGPALCGAEIVHYPLKEENGYLPDLDGIEPELADQAKMMVVSYPANPVCVTAPDEFYHKLIAFAKAHNIIILHDNAYSDIIFDGRVGKSFLAYEGAKEVGVEYNSLSKTYNLTGARISFVLGNRQIIQTFRRLRSQIDYGIFLPVQYAAIAALNGPQDSVTRNRAEYQARRDALCGGLRSIGWDVPDSQGSMFVWAPLPKGYHNSVDFCFELLERSGLLCTPGSAFGQLGEGHVRFALVQPVPVMQEIVAAVAKSGIIDHEA
ncbi:aminotransferase class I/II-fold pyridoxal phosphate-dependent enzyme [Pseudoflavonifractor capillosus]|uniref:aminotransferase class I/II-fold pyridoxal phosphate-dependent enzyme n=1 Tax=Pseudoflavonifractor capillosus TaxID=106588 RepID=UPI00195E5286|nr:aminotransferase class I/II-fold pyridoxal phosphate-dependent enzyme [Pseudoflavonifractor capillosus]MBM6693734.1 aminotransferase class I/II-fold pyridoxal phosphate-dependent enzyme [Pseudoflavonifractor capillosus]